MHKILLVIALAWLPAIVSAKTVLVVGDSLSAAYNIPIEQGWVNLLRLELQDRFNGTHKVINASISGDTTAGGLNRLPQAIESHQPDIVILELGANDGLRALSLAQMKGNLGKMIELSKANGADVILAGMQLPPNYGPFFNGRFQQIYKDLADDHNVTLIPFLLDGVGGVDHLVQSDGLHPVSKAQPIILENVLTYLVPALD